MKILQKNTKHFTHRTSEGIDTSKLLNIAQFLLLLPCAISNNTLQIERENSFWRSEPLLFT